MAEDYEKGVSKHREFLRKRQKASDQDQDYPVTRTAKDIVKGKEPKDDSQRRGMQGSIKLNLRQYRKDR